MSYLDRPKDLVQDTKQYVSSEYGRYILETLDEMADGYLSSASDVTFPYPERYAAKYSAIKEVINLIREPLDDDKSPRG